MMAAARSGGRHRIHSGVHLNQAFDTSRKSRFGAPPAVVAVAMIVLPVALSGTMIDAVDQVSQLPVGGKFSDTGAAPLTTMSIGLAAVLPLANRKLTVRVPAVAVTPVHSTKQAPLNPAWSLTTVLPGERVAFSASNRPGGGVVTQDIVEPLLLIRSAPPLVFWLFCTQNPLMFWKPMSNGLPLPRWAVKPLNRTVLPALAMTAGRASLDWNRTELLLNVMPLALWRYQPYDGRVPMLLGL